MRFSFNNHYKVIRQTSPMHDEKDMKDQDRAVWYPTALTACVCDGVTSSSFSADAAELVTQFSPVIFKGDIEDRLKTICDLLITLRNDKLNSKIIMPPNISKQTQEILQEVARENMRSSFQTTMVAANFVPEIQAIITSIITCGDSIFLAYAPDGELLASSLSNGTGPKSKGKQLCKDICLNKPSININFGPGDILLAKVLCTCSDHPQIAAKSGIKAEHIHNWLVCKALDKCDGQIPDISLSDRSSIQIEYGDLLLVPKYLAGTLVHTNCNGYVRFPYSCIIRMVKSYSNLLKVKKFQQSQSSTVVLPDHFYTGDWTYFQDRFPLGTHFILASDGFYNCFKDPDCLWSWLNHHQQDLQDDQKQINVMAELHRHLHNEHSDDDISFIFIYPQEPAGESSESVGDTGQDREI